MIHIIHKMLLLLKNYLNYLKDNFFESSFKKYNRLLFFLKSVFYNRPEEEQIIKDINIFLDEKRNRSN